MSKVKGRNLLVFVGGTAIAAAVSCELDMSTDLIEVAGSGQGEWLAYRAKQKWTKVTSQHLMTTGNTASLSTLNGKEVHLAFATTSDSDEAREASERKVDLVFYQNGKAICTRSEVTAKNGEFVNGKFEFTIQGSFTSIVPAPAYTQGYVWEMDYIDESGAIKENV